MSYQASGSQEPIRAVPRSQSVRALAVGAGEWAGAAAMQIRAGETGSIDRTLDATSVFGTRQATANAG
jgi:hypothetical protein